MPTFECPTCRKLFTVETREDAPHRPFCSNRCKMTDLGHWLSGTYKVSSPLPPEELDAHFRGREGRNDG